MDTKKLTLILFLMVLLPATQAQAGDTTLTGTASCVMPDLFELNTQPSAIEAPAPKPPVVQGASGSYEIKEEKRLIQSEENLVMKGSEGTENKVRVYSICAK